MFILQLHQECLYMVRSNEVVRGILGAIADSLPAVTLDHYWPQITRSPQWTISRKIDSQYMIIPCNAYEFLKTNNARVLFRHKLNNMPDRPGTNRRSSVGGAVFYEI